MKVSRMRMYTRGRAGRADRRNLRADPRRSRSRRWRSPQLGFHSRSWPGPSSFSHLPLPHTPASLSSEETERPEDNASGYRLQNKNLNGQEVGLDRYILTKKEPETQSNNTEVYSDQINLFGKLCSIICVTLIPWPQGFTFSYVPFDAILS